MNRAMFAGVAGLKAHQTRMDVIGNNIANVNTYGYKSQRCVFSDVFYQTISSATGGTANKGGTNPSSIGYGSRLAAIQTNMSQSSMQSTSYGLDVAITGEGFFQVMDQDGNIFYTKAGVLDYDSNGYLTDINGNFVLGSTTKDGAAGSSKIKLDNIGSVTPTKSSSKTTINGVEYTLTAGNPTKEGNVSLSINASDSLPVGKDYEVTISSTGAINVLLNSSKTFTLSALNTLINNGITAANGGKPLAAGSFTLAASPDKFGAGLTGAQIAGTNFGVDTGTITGMTAGAFGGLMNIENVGSGFSASLSPAATVNPTATFDSTVTPKKWTVAMTINGVTYSGTLGLSDTSSSLLLKNGASTTDYIQVTNPLATGLGSYAKSSGAVATLGADGLPTADITSGSPLLGYTSAPSLTATPSTPSKDLGLSSKPFTLSGGTAGGAVTLDQLSSIAIGADGVITVTHPDMGTVVAGKVSLANFSNSAGLELKGSNYYSATANSGKAVLCDPGSGGTGALQSNTLELSNVDLSAEFADMITTQRGFQANSRIITVSDTMLEELINLKR